MIRSRKTIELKDEADFQRDINLPPDPERVMEGLRDTGYTFNTAMADIRFPTLFGVFLCLSQQTLPQVQHLSVQSRLLMYGRRAALTLSSMSRTKMTLYTTG